MAETKAEARFFIGLDVHKESTTYAVRNRKGELIFEGACATQYCDLQQQLEPYISFGEIGLEASTSYYALYQEFLRNKLLCCITLSELRLRDESYASPQRLSR